MSEDNKPRKMTIKSWLKKASGKVSAEAFIQAHRSFLESGELVSVSAPILRQLDDKALLPTPALQALTQAVFTHMIQVEARVAEAKLAEPQESGSSKNWTATVYDSKGNVCTRVNANGKTVEMSQSFDLAQRAAGWADLRLTFDCGSDCFATIVHAPTVHEEVILRGDSLARVFRAKKGPLSKKTGVRDGKLSFGAKVAQSRAHFSHG